MVIQNNNIYITRGEEATFRATIYMNDGTPFRLLKPSEGSAPHDLIYFTVKTDAFSSDDAVLSDDENLVLRYKLDLDKGEDPIKKFASYDIHELAAEPTNDGHPDASDLATIKNYGKDVLYFYRDDTGKRTFYTADYTTDLSVADVADIDLERYVFDITFVIPTKDTKELFAKTYYWELDWVSTSYSTNTSKKFPLITPSQFIVRGSIYD